MSVKPRQSGRHVYLAQQSPVCWLRRRPAQRSRSRSPEDGSGVAVEAGGSHAVCGLHWLSNLKINLTINALLLSPVGADPQHREADHVQRGRQQRRGEAGARAGRRQQLPRHHQVHRQVLSNSKGKPSVRPCAADAQKKWYAVPAVMWAYLAADSASMLTLAFPCAADATE